MENDDFDRIIAPMRQRMVNAVWQVVRDADATEDVVQEVLTRVISQFERVRRHPNPPALLVRMCVNAAIDHLRRNHSRPAAVQCIPERHDPHDGAHAGMVERETRSRIVAALTKLPPREAEAMALLALEELPYPEIARAMGCREATVRVMVTRARRRLRKELATMGIGPEAIQS